MTQSKVPKQDEILASLQALGVIAAEEETSSNQPKSVPATGKAASQQEIVASLRALGVIADEAN